LNLFNNINDLIYKIYKFKIIFFYDLLICFFPEQGNNDFIKIQWPISFHFPDYGLLWSYYYFGYYCLEF
jgi:hypothetical protein